MGTKAASSTSRTAPTDVPTATDADVYRLPWRLVGHQWILDSTGEVIFDFGPPHKGEAEFWSFVVRAVNASVVHADLLAVLKRIVDWSDCQCEHDTVDCCANCADIDFHCPGCIAARVIAKAGQ